MVSGAAGYACGDKLLVVGRGVRFQRAVGQHQANLVIYSGGGAADAMLTNAKLQNTLKQAGHKLQMAQGDAQLDEALKAGKVDVVLANFSELGEIRRQLQSAPSKPAIVPVVFPSSKAEFAAAQKEYPFAVKASAGEIQYLSAIDAAMKFRLKTGTKSRGVDRQLSCESPDGGNFVVRVGSGAAGPGAGMASGGGRRLRFAQLPGHVHERSPPQLGTGAGSRAGADQHDHGGHTVRHHRPASGERRGSLHPLEVHSDAGAGAERSRSRIED
jgi:hypothetical protein